MSIGNNNFSEHNIEGYIICCTLILDIMLLRRF